MQRTYPQIPWCKDLTPMIHEMKDRIMSFVDLTQIFWAQPTFNQLTVRRVHRLCGYNEYFWLLACQCLSRSFVPLIDKNSIIFQNLIKFKLIRKIERNFYSFG